MGIVVLDKTTCNIFESTDLADELNACGITRLVIAGLQSDYCIRATTLGALELGYGVTLASDGHSTYDSKDRKALAITAAVNEELSTRATLIPAGEWAGRIHPKRRPPSARRRSPARSQRSSGTQSQHLGDGERADATRDCAWWVL